MTDKESLQLLHPHRITNPIPVGNAQRKKYTAVKIVAIALAITTFIYAYHQKCNLASIPGQSIPQPKNLWVYPHPKTFLPNSDSPNEPHAPLKAQFTQCDSTSTSIHFGTEFNITNEFHFRDIFRPSQSNVRGLVLVDRGSDDQSADIEVVATTRYSSSSAPDVQFGELSSSKTLTLDYSRVPDNDCIEIEVVIKLKPNTQKHVDEFSLATETLGINMQGSLTWTIDNLSMHSMHGNTVFKAGAPEPIITHNVSASSTTGEIYGYFVADAHLNLTNAAGTIGIYLIPRLNSDIPATFESLTATTTTGPLFISTLADFDLWPMLPFQHTTHIRSETGSLRAAVPHGTLTNMTAHTADLTATILPFGTHAPSPSEFYTAISHGNSWVHVYNTVQKSLGNGKFDPLLRLKSRHEVGSGTAGIVYPYSWWGTLEGKVNRGTIELDGSRLREVEKGDGWVKARRGQGESFMKSLVGEGELNVQIGLGA